MKKIFLFFIVICLFLFVFAESNYLNNKNIFYRNFDLFELFFASVAVTLFLFFFPILRYGSLSKFISILLKVLLINLTIFLIFIEASIVDFSGVGFGPEVIFHFSWDSFILGVKEYTAPLIVILITMVVLTISLVKISLLFKGKLSTLFFLCSIMLLFGFFEQTIYGRIYDGFVEYKQLMNIKSVHEDEVRELTFLDINTIHNSKSDISASTEINKNLLVIYLESFSSIFVNNPKYPELTPNLSRMVKDHHQIKPFISSGHFTMDGLISSHCGFIPNMLMGNNTLATGEKYFYNIPCFTDVLSTAGYHQEFWGGAKKSFAGKGDFLKDHGYDRVWGREDFEPEFSEQMSWWGLNDDVLFAQAEARMAQLHQTKQPYHISILTLGTHLKGYTSPSCPQYNHSSDRFIQAIHCTDYLVGSFLDSLTNKNLIDNTTVIITGDHTLFNTGYTQKLFGSDVSKQEIFGLIINDDLPAKINSMALYDLGPTVLKLLKISHNVNFLLGDVFGGSKNRPLLTRNNLFQNGKPVELSKDCVFDLNKKIQPKTTLSLCDQRAIMNKLYGYTEQFSKTSGISYRSESNIKIQFKNEQSGVNDLIIDGSSIRDYIRYNGFKVEPEWFSRKGVFTIKVDHKKYKLIELLNFRDVQGFDNYINKIHLEQGSSLILFSNNNEGNKVFFESVDKAFNVVECHNKLVCTIQPKNRQTIKINKVEDGFVLSQF